MPELEGIQSSVEAEEGLVRRVSVSLDAALVERQYQARLQQVARTVTVKGYRPGKVPGTVLQQMFGAQVRREVIEKLVRTSLADVIRQHSLRPMSEAKIDAPEFGKGTDVKFSATFEVLPDISLTGLDGIAVERPEPAIDDADIDVALDELRSQHAEWVPVTRAARDGDRVTVNSSGLVDGQQVEGIAGEGVVFVLGRGQFLVDIEREILGTRAGEERRFDVRIPADFGYADVAGHTVGLTVELLEVAEAQLPPLDGEFARRAGLKSADVSGIRREIGQRLAGEFAGHARAEINRQLFTQLASANPIPLPRTLVDHDAENLKQASMRALDIVDPDKAQPAESFRSLAEERLRIQLLIDAIVADQRIEADRDRVEQRVAALSPPRDPDQPPDDASLDLKARIEGDVLEEQVAEWLEERARVTPKPMSYRALLELSRKPKEG